MAAKRLRLLHEVVPKAVRIAVLVNPANAAATENTLRDLHEAAPIIGLQIQVFKAGTIGEIDDASATLGRERPDIGVSGLFLTGLIAGIAVYRSPHRLTSAALRIGRFAAGVR